MRFVSIKLREPVIERSMWLSAARCRTASGDTSSNRFLTLAASPQRSFPCRHGFIVLYKGHVCNFFAKLTVAPSFREIAPHVGEALWNNQLQIRDIQFNNIHQLFETRQFQPAVARSRNGKVACETRLSRTRSIISAAHLTPFIEEICF